MTEIQKLQLQRVTQVEKSKELLTQPVKEKDEPTPEFIQLLAKSMGVSINEAKKMTTRGGFN